MPCLSALGGAPSVEVRYGPDTDYQECLKEKAAGSMLSDSWQQQFLEGRGAGKEVRTQDAARHAWALKSCRLWLHCVSPCLDRKIGTGGWRYFGGEDHPIVKKAMHGKSEDFPSVGS